MENKFTNSPNLLDIGIIGGGQLGKMIILEGKKLGLKFIILDPDKTCPASSVADGQIVGDYYDSEKIKQLASKCNLITYELEHINSDVLIELSSKAFRIEPSPSTLKMIQNKYRQKQFLKRHNISTTEFESVDSVDDIKNYIAKEGLPVILKSCYGGYDGKGNKVIKNEPDIEIAYKLLEGDTKDLMIEKYISFMKEVSVIAARSTSGEVQIYPIAENIHHDNILRTTIVPALVSQEILDNATQLALEVMEHLDGAGVFCIEMFVDANGEVLVNEIAPRVHNSGHYTIEGCNVSQFQQHLRAILGYPLATPYLIKPSVMINILGEEFIEGKAVVKGLPSVLEDADTYVHLYGKELTKPLRKMGHVTLLGENIEELLDRSEKVRDILKIISY